MKYTFGFETVGADDKHLDIQLSLFRLNCFTRGIFAYITAVVVLLFIQSVLFIIEVTEHRFWIILFPNHVTIGILAFLLVSLINCICYSGNTNIIEPLPKMIYIQWALYTTMLPLSYVALIFANWNGYMASPAQRGTKWMNMIIMSFFVLWGCYETRWRHLILSVSFFWLHLIFIFIYANVYDTFPYRTEIDGVTVLQSILFFTFLIIVFHGASVLIHQFKVFKLHGGSLMKTAAVI